MGDPLDSVFTRFPELETPRLRLRETRPADAEAILAVLCQEAVTRYYSLTPLTSLDQAQAIVARRAAAFQRRERIRWTLACREDDVVIGSCGYVNWNQEAARAEIGYELSPEFQGCGLMREALTATIEFGWTQMRLHRIEALVMPANAPSLRLLHRLGFQEEGLLRHYGFWKGRFHDLKILSLLKEEWYA